jgi:hypothetical protein
LTELAWWMDRTLSGYLTLNDDGIQDAWAMAARAERDLARYAGEPFDSQTREQLAAYEQRFGTKP